MALSVRPLVAYRRSPRLHAHRQLHRQGLPAFLPRHRLRRRLGHASGHRVAGAGAGGPRRPGALPVRHGHPHGAGLQLQKVPRRRAQRGHQRRGRRHGERRERRPVQALDQPAEAPRQSGGATGERTCRHVAEPDHRGIHQTSPKHHRRSAQAPWWCVRGKRSPFHLERILYNNRHQHQTFRTVTQNMDLF